MIRSRVPVLVQVALDEAHVCCEELAQAPAAEPAAACNVPASEPHTGMELPGAAPDSLQTNTERELKQVRCSAAQPLPLQRACTSGEWPAIEHRH